MICRLTPPLCLNYLGLIHLDSHITKKNDLVETSFTKIMGHLDLISFVNEGFNLYLPLFISLFCLATFFQFGSKLMHNLGFEQFILDDEMTTELIREGQEFVKRERNKRMRSIEVDSARDRRRIMTNRNEVPELPSHPPLVRRESNESGSRTELLNDVEPVDYSSNWHTSFQTQKGLFDDI